MENEKKYTEQSNAMKELWNDEQRRKEVIAHMKESGKKRRKHKDIDVAQGEDYATYQRSYQRKYRELHPEYYRERRKYNEEKKNGFTGTYKEWREQNGKSI